MRWLVFGVVLLASAATGAVADRLGATAAMLAPAVAAAVVVGAAAAHLAAVRSSAAGSGTTSAVPGPALVTR
jgi:hypothetical protein